MDRRRNGELTYMDIFRKDCKVLSNEIRFTCVGVPSVMMCGGEVVF